MPRDGYVVVAEGDQGELVRVYTTPQRPMAKAARTALRSLNIGARVLSAAQWERLVREVNPKCRG